MTVKQASNLICPFMSIAHPDIAEWIRCETTNCMAWKQNQPTYWECDCGTRKSKYEDQVQCYDCREYTSKPVHVNKSNSDECEGYCSRLPH